MRLDLPERPAPARPADAPAPAGSPAQLPGLALGEAHLHALSQALAATAAELDENGAFPHDNLALLKRQGLTALAVGPAWGGPGGSLADARAVVAAVARGEPATALVLTMNLMLTRALSRPDCRWPAAVRDAVLRGAVQHGHLGNQLRVEPELGTPARGGLPATVAVRTAEGWRLSGHKLYTTGIDGLHWLVVWGRTDEPQPRVGQFLVPHDAPGLRTVRSWDHLGMRATASDEVVLDQVPIPADHAVDLRLPADWQTAPDMEQAAWMNVLLASLYDAVARNARDWLLDFLHQRAPSSLGAPLATLARVQETVGEIELLLQTNTALLDQATAAAVAGRPGSVSASGLLKAACTRNAVAVVQLAIAQAGNHGLSRRNPLQRHLRDVLCGRVHTPQDDSALVAAGRAALGERRG